MKLDLPHVPHCVPAREEQAWNERQLASTVVAPQVRLWSYRQAAVVLGCAQRQALDNLPGAAISGMETLVRQAGGGAVLVGPWMLSASIALPHEHPLVTASPVSSYRWLGELYAGVLRNLGLAAHAVSPEEARDFEHAHDLGKSLDWACYGGISPWEVVVGQRKIVGLAQIRRRTGILLVAGLLLERPEWPLLCQAMDRPATHVYHLAQRTTSCADEIGVAPSILEIAHPLAWALDAAVRGQAHPGLPHDRHPLFVQTTKETV